MPTCEGPAGVEGSWGGAGRGQGVGAWEGGGRGARVPPRSPPPGSRTRLQRLPVAQPPEVEAPHVPPQLLQLCQHARQRGRDGAHAAGAARGERAARV
jgi:hypothetical protein